MVKEIIIPKDNLAQIEEVRVIEGQQLTERDFFIKEVGDKVEEVGEDLKEGVKDLGNKIGSLFE